MTIPPNFPWVVLIISILVIVLREPLGNLIKRTIGVEYKDQRRLFKLKASESSENANIKRTDLESIVTAKELDKSSESTSRFSTSEAHAFYETCAAGYDDANSPFLWETHNRIVEDLVNDLPKSGGTVVDFGGGTGRFIALGASIHAGAVLKKWVNYDFSSKMLSEFHDNMKTVACKYEAVCADINKLDDWNNHEEFDAAILCFVLSSMQTSPDFKKIKRRLRKGGVLIVAEGDPIYTMKKECVWPVKMDKQRFEMSIRPINAAEVIADILESGFELIHIKIVKKKIEGNAVPYSYVMSFLS